jgi:hypothetical protein
MTDDRRSDERVSMTLPVKWYGVTGTHEGRTEDISLGGCFVNSSGRVDVGEIVGLAIQLPAGDWLEVRGEVTAYQERIGFGVFFPFLTDEEEQTLRELIT